MNDCQAVSQELSSRLQLSYEPVGVQLFADKEPLPQDIAFSQENLKSYCQAVALAGKGCTLLLRKEQMGCKLGTSVLGFEQDMEAFLDDGVLEKYGVGLYASEEASAATIRQSFYLSPGKTQAVLVAPLKIFQHTPQVVVFTADSEQVMWLLYALNYERGGKMELPQSGGALGGCADITALPILAGVANITFLGLGCRIKSSLDPCHLMLGLPGTGLTAVYTHIQELAKPIAMLRSSRAAKTG